MDGLDGQEKNGLYMITTINEFKRSLLENNTFLDDEIYSLWKNVYNRPKEKDAFNNIIINSKNTNCKICKMVTTHQYDIHGNKKCVKCGNVTSINEHNEKDYKFSINQKVYVHNIDGTYETGVVSKIEYNPEYSSTDYYVRLDADGAEEIYPDGEMYEMQYVYHFTLPKYFVEIVKSNTLKADEAKCISFTIDPELWVFKEFENEDQDIGIRMKFDIKDLPHLYPYDDSQHGTDLSHEKEYRTESGDIKNILDKIHSIEALLVYKEYLKENLPLEIFNKITF